MLIIIDILTCVICSPHAHTTYTIHKQVFQILILRTDDRYFAKQIEMRENETFNTWLLQITIKMWCCIIVLIKPE